MGQEASLAWLLLKILWPPCLAWLHNPPWHHTLVWPCHQEWDHSLAWLHISLEWPLTLAWDHKLERSLKQVELHKLANILVPTQATILHLQTLSTWAVWQQPCLPPPRSSNQHPLKSPNILKEPPSRELQTRVLSLLIKT